MSKRQRAKDDEEWLPLSKSRSRTVARKEAPNDTFFRLPDELILLVFSFVPLLARARVAQVSRRFNRVMLDWTLWKRIPTVLQKDSFDKRIRKRIEAQFGTSRPTKMALRQFLSPVLPSKKRRSIVAFMRRVCGKVCKFCNRYVPGRMTLHWTGEKHCKACRSRLELNLVSFTLAERIYGCTRSEFAACDSFVVSAGMYGKTIKCRTVDVLAEKAKSLELAQDGTIYWPCKRTDCLAKHNANEWHPLESDYDPYEWATPSSSKVLICNKLWQRQSQFLVERGSYRDIHKQAIQHMERCLTEKTIARSPRE